MTDKEPCQHCGRRSRHYGRGLCLGCWRQPAVRGLYKRQPPTNAAPCRAGCGRHANRPRGLCRKCYYAPGAFAAYPPTSNYGNKGVPDSDRPGRLPAPAAAAPGSPDKLALMAARAAAGEQLFHPDEPRLAPPVGSSWGRAACFLGADARDVERQEEVMRAIVG